MSNNVCLFYADENDVKGLCGLHKEFQKTDDNEKRRKMHPWGAFISIRVNISAFHLKD